LLSLPDVVESTYVQSTLKTVYEACFLKFEGGKLGAANGMKPDGTPEDPHSTHPQ
jgi:non-lysosomal glucosylceramidase